jgi:hypothetical protein
MTIAYMVPGFLGSQLSRGQDGSGLLWVNFADLVLGNVGQLRLAADGVSPGPPDGVQLYPQLPLPDYYFPAIALLGQQLGPAGYVIHTYPQDFRLDDRIVAPSLAARIVAEVDPADPCTLIGHSDGGVICRLAWRQLVSQGKSGLVRRIITLGTPHWGSYSPVRAWSLDSDLVYQIWALSLGSVPFWLNNPVQLALHTWTPTQIARLTATWPGFYYLLPSLLAPDAPEDPHRSAVFNVPWPTDVGLSPHWMSDAVATYQPLLADPSTIPPPWILTCVAGTGFATVARLSNPAALGTSNGYVADADGDGSVTRSSALLAGSAQVLVQSAHADLPFVAAASGQLAQWITAIRNPPAPAPPMQHGAGEMIGFLRGPPSPAEVLIAPGC